MNSDLNFAVSTEGLDEKGRVVEEQAKIMDEAMTEIEEARKVLDSWKSSNKELYDAKINRALPKMREMVDVVRSYGNVARVTSSRLRDVENRIRQSIEENG